MSFSGEVKEELVGQPIGARHCQIAELSAILGLYAKVEKKDGYVVCLPLENKYAVRKCFTILNKTFNIETNVVPNDFENAKSYIEFSEQHYDMERIIMPLHLDNPERLLGSACCKKAYLRGAYLASGFVSDPNKSYHLEFAENSLEAAKLLVRLLEDFSIEARITIRKKYHIVYLKEVSAIADVLNLMGAHVSMMELVNARIVKEVRNGVNRRVNCEAANITKTVNASTKQIEDIYLIRDRVGLDKLPDTLRQMAEIRVQFPEMSLTELGKHLEPPVGKSGVNHRLRKISEFADDIR